MNGHEVTHNFHEKLDAFRKSDAEREALVQVPRKSSCRAQYSHLGGWYTYLHVTFRK